MKTLKHMIHEKYKIRLSTAQSCKSFAAVKFILPIKRREACYPGGTCSKPRASVRAEGDLVTLEELHRAVALLGESGDDTFLSLPIPIHISEIQHRLIRYRRPALNWLETLNFKQRHKCTEIKMYLITLHQNSTQNDTYIRTHKNV